MHMTAQRFSMRQNLGSSCAGTPDAFVGVHLLAVHLTEICLCYTEKTYTCIAS